METPEAHGHSVTGIRWLDLSLALAAFLTSMVSIWIAVQHGHEMERLVQANSLPFLEINQSNIGEAGEKRLRLVVTNQGVGPARIATAEVSVNGQAVPMARHIIDRCCAPGLANAADPTRLGIQQGDLVTSTALGHMIRPGQSINMIDWQVRPESEALTQQVWRALGDGTVEVKLCYCSVFEDCWLRTNKDKRPRAVKECRMPKVPYRE